MKKLTLFFVALFTATIAFAQTEIDGIYYNLNYRNKTAEVTYQYGSSYDNYSGVTSITIPEKVTYNSTEYSVTSIGYGAFANCSSLTSISIPNSVTSIETLAFELCSSLTSITIGNSVTSIGNSAFYGCTSLTSISIGNSVTSIGDGAFSWCSFLSSITIGNSVTSIGNEAFYGCSRLTSITMEATTPPTLGTNAFDQGRAIHIPDNTLSAYKSAWGTDYVYVNNETSLTINVETPGTLSDLIIDAGFRPIEVAKLKVTGTLNDDDFTCMRGTMTSLVDVDLSEITNTTGVNFYEKNNLVKIILPNNLTTIGSQAFWQCSSLTSITIPNSVTSIEDLAFQACSSLTSITIPDSVTSIGIYAFSWCSSLTSITIPNSVTSIGGETFYDCEKLDTITCLGSTPPAAENLGANTQTCVLVVPKEAYSDYLEHAYWGQFFNIRTIGDKEITASTNNPAWGKVNGAGVFNENETATLTAIPNNGYHFVKWDDEVTDNPRTVVVTQDSTFTAIFEANIFTITTAVNDEDMGSVTEGGEYAYSTEVTLSATANTNYRFAQWSDGNTDNPRTITVTENKTYTAEFELNTYTLIAHSYSPNMGGVKITLTAEPIKGFEFVGWSDGSTENPYEFYITENTELYAYFQIAQGGNPVDLENSKISSANIYTTNGTLHVENATENYHILDAAGRLIYSGNASTLQLPRGIYLITMGGEAEKIVL